MVTTLVFSDVVCFLHFLSTSSRLLATLRDKDNFKLKIETSYEKELEKLSCSDNYMKFEKIMSIGEIQIASEFDIEVYVRFQPATRRGQKNDIELAD
jgi:uncharacterized protein YktA (UPF0223 family)